MCGGDGVFLGFWGIFGGFFNGFIIQFIPNMLLMMFYSNYSFLIN